MKLFSKIFVLGAALAVSTTAALAAPIITGSIGFGGNGTYNSATGAFTPGAVIPAAGSLFGDNAYVNTAGTGSLSAFTFGNAAHFSAFNTNSLPGTVFTATEGGVTISFTLQNAVSGISPGGPGFSGTGMLSETGYANTLYNFTFTSTGGVTFTSMATAAATPEPSSLLLLGTGLMGAAGMVFRKRQLV